MNRTLAASAALFSLAMTLGAPAARAGVTFINYGVAIPKGERLLTDFASRGSLAGGVLFTGSTPDVSAAPAFGPASVDEAQYLSIPGGGSAELFLPNPTRGISIYVGSLDSWNTISFGGPGGVTYSGSQLGAVSGRFNGDRAGGETNGRFIFTFDEPVTSITFTSSEPAFEIADVAAAVPEPGAWALMLVGFGALGAAVRRSRLRTSTTS